MLPQPKKVTHRSLGQEGGHELARTAMAASLRIYAPASSEMVYVAHPSALAALIVSFWSTCCMVRNLP